jgi:negative regulator of flagellin synthesis FlgM
MHSHGSSLLRGPVSRERNCWSLPRDSNPYTLMNDRTEKPAYEPEVRTDLVQRVRREIAAGTYDTPEKWEAALDRLLDRLEREER